MNTSGGYQSNRKARFGGMEAKQESTATEQQELHRTGNTGGGGGGDYQQQWWSRWRIRYSNNKAINFNR